MSLIAHRMRQWDVASAARVDHFVANSQNVARRVWKYLPPRCHRYLPTGGHGFLPAAAGEPDEFYLYVGQLTRYKRVDIAIEAFNASANLVIIGDGEQPR